MAFRGFDERALRRERVATPPMTPVQALEGHAHKSGRTFVLLRADVPELDVTAVPDHVEDEPTQPMSIDS